MKIFLFTAFLLATFAFLYFRDTTSQVSYLVISIENLYLEDGFSKDPAFVELLEQAHKFNFHHYSGPTDGNVNIVKQLTPWSSKGDHKFIPVGLGDIVKNDTRYFTDLDVPFLTEIPNDFSLLKISNSILGNLMKKINKPPFFMLVSCGFLNAPLYDKDIEDFYGYGLNVFEDRELNRLIFEINPATKDFIPMKILFDDARFSSATSFQVNKIEKYKMSIPSINDHFESYFRGNTKQLDDELVKKIYNKKKKILGQFLANLLNTAYKFSENRKLIILLTKSNWRASDTNSFMQDRFFSSIKLKKMFLVLSNDNNNFRDNYLMLGPSDHELINKLKSK